jgi:hypothetical protein
MTDKDRLLFIYGCWEEHIATFPTLDEDSLRRLFEDTNEALEGESQEPIKWEEFPRLLRAAMDEGQALVQEEIALAKRLLASQ